MENGTKGYRAGSRGFGGIERALANVKEGERASSTQDWRCDRKRDNTLGSIKVDGRDVRAWGGGDRARGK